MSPAIHCFSWILTAHYHDRKFQQNGRHLSHTNPIRTLIHVIVMFPFGSRDSSVTTVISLGAKRSRNRGSTPGSGNTFVSSAKIQTRCGSHQVLIQWSSGEILMGEVHTYPNTTLLTRRFHRVPRGDLNFMYICCPCSSGLPHSLSTAISLVNVPFVTVNTPTRATRPAHFILISRAGCQSSSNILQSLVTSSPLLPNIHSAQCTAPCSRVLHSN